MAFRAFLSLLGLIVLLACPPHVLGQDAADDPPTTPPGYEDREDVTDITQYRLPAWTFTTVTLDLGGNTRRERSTISNDFGNTDPEETRSRYSFQTTPQLLTFTESEARQFELIVSSDLDLGGTSVAREGTGILNIDESTSTFSTALDIDLDWNEYVAGETFLTARTGVLADYNRTGEEITENDVLARDRTETTILYTSSSRLGIGFGRIRDVTPVFRALRVRERLNRIGRENVMGADDVQAAARQFARRPGYGPVYDRPDKYFWNDLFSRADGANADLQPYEVFYVAEALQEPIARRFEGYEVTAGIMLDYGNLLQKRDAEFQPDARSRTLRHSYGPFLRGEYVTNLNRRQQVALQSNVRYTVPTDDRSLPENRLFMDASADWLWEIADRYRINTEANAFYARARSAGDDVDIDRTSTDWSSSLESNLTVFLENRLAVTAGAGFRYGRDRFETDAPASGSEVSQSEIFLNVGVRYFLFRNLSI